MRLLRLSLSIGLMVGLAAVLVGCGPAAAPAKDSTAGSPTPQSPPTIATTVVTPEDAERVATSPATITKPATNSEPAGPVRFPADRPISGDRAELVSSPVPSITPDPGPALTVVPESPETQPSEREDSPQSGTGYILTADQEDGAAPLSNSDSSNGNPAGISRASGTAGSQGQSDTLEGRPYTWKDGDRTLTVLLQTDLRVGEDGEIDLREESEELADTIVTGSRKGDVGEKGVSSSDSGSQPVFRSESGELMTLPGGVLLALDPEWSRGEADAFFGRNGIKLSRVSDLEFVTNGFFVGTEPGFPSLNLANTLAGQGGVILSSPNWWTQISPE